MDVAENAVTDNDQVDLRSGDQGILLFNRINVIVDENGENQFSGDESEISTIVAKLFTEDNLLLTQVDDYGFGIERDSGRRYFYVKELKNPGSHSIFVYLDEVNSSDSIIGGIDCVSETCCSECVVQNGTCSCHIVDCHDPWEDRPNCSTATAAIYI